MSVSEAMEEGLEGRRKGASGGDSPIATFMDSPSRLPDILPSNSDEKIPDRATGLLISNLFFENKITPDSHFKGSQWLAIFLILGHSLPNEDWVPEGLESIPSHQCQSWAY